MQDFFFDVLHFLLRVHKAVHRKKDNEKRRLTRNQLIFLRKWKEKPFRFAL